VNSNKILALLLSSMAVFPVFASDFDGSKALICATVEARDCVLGSDCFTGHARKIGAPTFLRIDFDKKVVTGTERTSSISNLDKNDDQVLIQGVDLDFGWALALDQETGDFSASLTNRNGTFLLFGSCTPQ
jgi:hypothetical protein